MRRMLMLCLMLALGGASPGMAANSKPVITVFAAASLTEALQAAGVAYSARTGVPVRFSFASSAAIARQLQAGAPADIFVSADVEWMDYAQSHGLIAPATRADLARGQLALIAPAGSSVRLRIGQGMPLVAALGAAGRLAIGDPGSVPAGRYARAALQSLGVWDGVMGRLAPAENVRTALAYVARGEAPLGIVYETDARAEPRVHVIGIFPAASHKPIVYPIALTRHAVPSAGGFAAFLRSAPGQAIFRRFGFLAAQ